MSVGSVVAVLLGLLLLVVAVVVLRSERPHPWPSILIAMAGSAVCFAVGGNDSDRSGPSIATVAAALVGVVSVIAAVVAMRPRSRESAPSRIPILLAAVATVVAGAGLVLNQLVN